MSSRPPRTRRQFARQIVKAMRKSMRMEPEKWRCEDGDVFFVDLPEIRYFHNTLHYKGCHVWLPILQRWRLRRGVRKWWLRSIHEDIKAQFPVCWF